MQSLYNIAYKRITYMLNNCNTIYFIKTISVSHCTGHVDTTFVRIFEPYRWNNLPPLYVGAKEIKNELMYFIKRGSGEVTSCASVFPEAQ
jgi:hypothetical protein